MDIRILSIVTVLGSMPLFVLVASICRRSILDAQRETLQFLENWGGIAPTILKTWLRTTIGASISFGLLMCLSYGFNELGDMSASKISSIYNFFDEPYTRWSVENEQEWKGFRDKIRENWKLVYPSEDIANDPELWKGWKNDRGKEVIRVSRTLAWYASLLFVACLFDFFRRKYFDRAVASLLIGVISFSILVAIWTDQKSHYIREVHLANRTLGVHAAPVPSSYPGAPNQSLQTDAASMRR